MVKLVVFDLDGTLAESKSPLDAEMARLLHTLLGLVKVAIISGGNWPQFQKQVVLRLPKGDSLRNLSLLPACGTKFYRYETAWELLYSEDFSPVQSAKIKDALRRALEAMHFVAHKSWGEQIEDRGSQITFSALGQLAPLDEKKRWDADLAKRKKMQAFLGTLIPEFSVRIGGTTSIDVTKLGIDKAYGIRKLRETLGMPIPEMLFLGDALFPGGNDYPAKEAGARCIRVRDLEETKRVIEGVIACLAEEACR